MIRFECTIQEGSVSDDLRPTLTAAIARACNDVLGADQGPLEVVWMVIPIGFGFRAGQPSSTSLVRGQIPDGCASETRGRLLTSIGDAWCQITDATPEELMVSARDWSWSG